MFPHRLECGSLLPLFHPTTSPHSAVPQTTDDEEKRRQAAALHMCLRSVWKGRARCRPLALMLVLLVPFVARPAELPDLPKINMADFLPAIRQQVQRADAAARAHPRNADASGNLGMVLDAYQQYESAALCYERAHRLDLHSFRWAYYLGSIQAHQGKFDQAIVSLREALRLSPGYLPARLKLGDSVLAAGDLDESARIYKSISEGTAESGGGESPRRPAAAEALYGMGRIETARGDTLSATDFYRQACELFPSYGAAQYALALAYRKIGQPDQAEQYFRVYQANMSATPPVEDPLLAAVQALDLGAEAHLRRSVELEQQGRLNEAIAEQEQALAIDPQNVQANINLISLDARVGERGKAEQHFQAAVRLNPGRADAYYNHGVILTSQDKFAEAEQAFRQALRLNPYYAEAHNNLGVMLEKQGRTEDALAEYEAALQSQPNFRLAHYHVATIQARQKKYDAAIEHLLQTLEPQDESTPVYLYALAIAYGRNGNRDNAVKYIHMARDQAAARNQSQLLVSIDRDLQSLEQQAPPR